MAKRYQDKYYTPATVVKAVLKVIEKEIMPLDKFNRIIEPSAGAGAFIKELPESTISYDIAPEYEGIICADYLKENIPYLENSIVIGNPPFGRSGMLAKEFIKKSMERSDYVAFILPGDNYNRKSSIPGIKLFKSYMLPEVKYSGVKLKCCFNIYCKGDEEKKKIKDVDIYEFSRNKNTTKKEEEEYLKKDCDYRIISYGTIRLIGKNEKTRVQELKINFKVKRNFKYILEKYIKEKANISVSAANISKQDIVDLIYDNYPELRGN